MRATVMLIVASVVGTIVEQKQGYYVQVPEKNRELSDANTNLQILNTGLTEYENGCPVANKKYASRIRIWRKK
jgi:hypothetical protein